MNNTISISEFLAKQGIQFQERNGELITKCLFNNCDDKTKHAGHLYFDKNTSRYHCKKCDCSGNIFTLAEFLKVDKKDLYLSQRTPSKNLITIIEKAHQALPEEIREYLHERGITDELIRKYKIGYGEFYKEKWITIPIFDQNGEYQFIKLRRNPFDTSEEAKYKFYPSGSESTLFGWDVNLRKPEKIVICEGEFDKMILESQGVEAITSTAGAGTFRNEWVQSLTGTKEIIVCFDKDETGEKHQSKLAETLLEELPESEIYTVSFPENMNGKDITDYFIKNSGTKNEFLENFLTHKKREKIDPSEFHEISIKEVAEILDITIKHDYVNKVITFLCMLSAFTEEDQFNISFNAPSSSGKSYIALEITSLFPEKDMMKLGYCSPTAFFHEHGEFNKETNTITVDLSRKIIVFMDQPHTGLLERFRSLLSHDQKIIDSKITDKSRRGDMKTKNIAIKGFPAVIFCSAGLNMDEQEATRFLLLSPEITQEKISEAVRAKIEKESDKAAYTLKVESDSRRKAFIQRVKAIKEEKIREVKIEDPAEIRKVFIGDEGKKLQPRAQRDIARFLHIVKVIALLNLWFRKREGNVIYATSEDIQEALKLWQVISKSQEFNLPPYIYNLYWEVIVPCHLEKSDIGKKLGITRQDILEKHYAVYGRFISAIKLRQEILPMLITSGLVQELQDENDKRISRIVPQKLEK